VWWDPHKPLYCKCSAESSSPKEFRKSVKIWQHCDHEFGAQFPAHRIHVVRSFSVASSMHNVVVNCLTVSKPGPVNVTVCVSNYIGDDCCGEWSSTTEVKFCEATSSNSDSFYVYKLKRVRRPTVTWLTAQRRHQLPTPVSHIVSCFNNSVTQRLRWFGDLPTAYIGLHYCEVELW